MFRLTLTLTLIGEMHCGLPAPHYEVRARVEPRFWVRVRVRVRVVIRVEVHYAYGDRFNQVCISMIHVLPAGSRLSSCECY